MSEPSILTLFFSCNNFMNFIKDKTKVCTDSECLINHFKKLSTSKNSFSSDLKSLDSLLSKRFDSKLPYFEQFLLILQDFHIHEIQHCSGSEEFCFFHHFFPSSLEKSCNCSSNFQIFPVINCESIPNFHATHSMLQTSSRLFRKLFKFFNDHKDCDAKINFIADKIGETLIILLQNSASSDFLKIAASAPSHFCNEDLVLTANSENYDLASYLVTDGTGVQLFKQVKGLFHWEVGRPGDMKKKSYVEGIKDFISKGELPIALIYHQSKSEFFIESENFTCIEILNIKSSKNQSQLNIDKKFIDLEFRNCSVCGISTNSICCDFGEQNSYWKCGCGKISRFSVCECGKKQPYCKICLIPLNAFVTDCRQCGNQVKSAEACEVCGFKIGEMCLGCYENLILCEICGHLNLPGTGYGCWRCMNPFKHLFRLN